MVQFTDATTFSICRAPHFYCYSECCYAEFFLALEPNHTGGLYYKQVMIVMTLACIIKLEIIIIDDPSLS
jgi:hypothetical protein